MKRGGQEDKILSALRRAGRKGLTSMELFEQTKVMNYTGRISDLRERGYRIECVHEEKRKWGSGQICRYRLILDLGNSPSGARLARESGEDRSAELFQVHNSPYGQKIEP